MLLLLACLMSFTAGIPVYEDQHISLNNSTPEMAASINNNYLLKVLCSQPLEKSNCQRRTICLSSNQVFASTCDYHNALCQGQIPYDAAHVQCKEQFRLVSCEKYKSKCPSTVEPVCGHNTNKYYQNECFVCKGKEDKLESFAMIAEHRRCIMDKTKDPLLIRWASKSLQSTAIGF